MRTGERGNGLRYGGLGVASFVGLHPCNAWEFSTERAEGKSPVTSQLAETGAANAQSLGANHLLKPAFVCCTKRIVPRR